MIAAASLITTSVMASKQQKAAEKAARKNEANAERQRDFDTAMYNQEHYRDITQDADFMNQARKADEQLDNQRSLDESRGAMYGETTPASLAAADKRQKAYVDSIADMAGNMAAVRRGDTALYQQQMGNFFGKVNANNLNTQQMSLASANSSAQGSINATNALGNAVGEGIGAYKQLKDEGATGKDLWFGVPKGS